MNTNLKKYLPWAVALIAVIAMVVALGINHGSHGDMAAAPRAMDSTPEASGSHTGDSANPTVAGSMKAPGGLEVSQNNYTLNVLNSNLTAGKAEPVKFMIADAAGAPVKDYEIMHDKQLHLIAVRRNSTGFQHVHPTLDSQGNWNAQVDLTPGSWRLFADFKAKGSTPLVLGTDLWVPGEISQQQPFSVSRVSSVDGYTVNLAGDIESGKESKLILTVSRNGKPVTDLQPYLAAYGHLVALRRGDLAYLHVHPDGQPGDGKTSAGPGVVFHTQVLSRGDYNFYFDFQHEGVVRTASFALAATAGTPSTATSPAPALASSVATGHEGHSDQ